MMDTLPLDPAGDYFDPEVETMSRENIERLQEARILQLVPYVYARSKLTRKIWDRAGITPSDIRSLADFREKVPFINKDSIREYRDENSDPFGGLLCASPPHLSGVGFTSGTTGDPTPVPRASESLNQYHQKRDYWQIGARAGDYVTYMLNTFRLGHHSDRWRSVGYRMFPLEHAASEIPRLIEGSRLLKPKVLHMISSPMILALEKYQNQTGTDLREAFSSYLGAVFGGEPLGPRSRKMVESWGLEIFQYGNLGDICGLMECREHDGMHTWEDMVLVEHIDPVTTEPAADGTRGELVVTALMDDVAPLVRYRTDDLVEFTRAPCRCGRNHGRMKPIGRIGDEMLIQGKSVLPVDLLPILQDIPATCAGLFQLIRPSREMDTLSLRVGFDESLIEGSEQALMGEIADRVRSALSVPVRVELRSNADLLKLGPPHKIPRVTKQ